MSEPALSLDLSVVYNAKDPQHNLQLIEKLEASCVYRKRLETTSSREIVQAVKQCCKFLTKHSYSNLLIPRRISSAVVPALILSSSEPPDKLYQKILATSSPYYRDTLWIIEDRFGTLETGCLRLDSE